MTEVPTTSLFFRAQTVADLIAVARAAPEGVFGRMAELVPTGATAQAFVDLAGAQGGRLPPDQAERLHPNLLLAATLPSEDFEGFVVASALLLADRLQSGAGTDDLFHHWDTLEERYRETSAPVRAALLRGFALCHALGQVALEGPPAGTDLVTEPRAAALAALAALATSMTEAELENVARADRGKDIEQHRGSLLDRLRALPNRPPDPWFAAEVVELSSHIPGTPGFAPCTALLLIDAIHTGDTRGAAAYRWMSIGAGYDALPEPDRATIHGGYRHLAESAPAWDPYWDWNAERVAASGTLLPFPPA